jgi:hypothetical protein
MATRRTPIGWIIVAVLATPVAIGVIRCRFFDDPLPKERPPCPVALEGGCAAEVLADARRDGRLGPLLDRLNESNQLETIFAQYTAAMEAAMERESGPIFSAACRNVGILIHLCPERPGIGPIHPLPLAIGRALLEDPSLSEAQAHAITLAWMGRYEGRRAESMAQTLYEEVVSHNDLATLSDGVKGEGAKVLSLPIGPKPGSWTEKDRRKARAKLAAAGFSAM